MKQIAEKLKEKEREKNEKDFISFNVNFDINWLRQPDNHCHNR